MGTSSEPDHLYHYTDARGLIGIVTQAVLWATDAEFLNDAQELKYGRDELHQALIARAGELSPNPDRAVRLAPPGCGGAESSG